MVSRKKFIKSSSGYVRKSLHQMTSDGNIYEHDYMTITQPSNFAPGQIQVPLYGDSNFIFTIRRQKNGQYNVINGEWLKSSDDDFWTNEDLGVIDAQANDPNYIKPYFSSLTDFAYYGSAIELIRSTVTSVIKYFPGGIYITESLIEDFFDEEGKYIDGVNGKYYVRNDFMIDLISESVDDADNPYRFMCLTAHEFEIDGKSIDWEATVFDIDCPKNGDLLYKVSFGHGVEIECYYVDGEHILCSNQSNILIRPNEMALKEFLFNLSDFGRVLLNRETYPLHKAVFETYFENKRGVVKMRHKEYTWPVAKDGYNIEITNNSFSEYVSDLIKMASFYDEVWCDNFYRAMAHESVKNLDWTFERVSDKENIDNDDLDFSRMQMIMRIYGRQLDEIKRYIDGIGFVNNITYNQENNPADYVLSDALEMMGWEIKNLFIKNDGLYSNRLYNGESLGYTTSEANNEFLRRLKLNSTYIFSQKGTKKCLKTLLSLFGMEEGVHFNIIEKIYEASNLLDVDEVKNINVQKTSYNTTYQTEYGELSGIPVKEVEGKLVPWYSIDKKYDKDMYFEMAGGWDSRETMEVKDINGTLCTLSGIGPFFKDTQKQIKYVNDIDELLSLPSDFISNEEFVYVYNINDEFVDIDTASHYFYIHDALDRYEIDTLWTNDDDLSELRGWYSIQISELTNGTTSALGEKILLYLNQREETEGNNPHHGNKKYDNGESWRERFNSIFKPSIEYMKSFVGVESVDEEEAAKLGFGLMIKNKRDGKTFIVTDELESAKKLNSKQLEINFVEDTEVYTKDFIEEYVLFYLKQIIPSTTILKITYNVKDLLYGITIDKQ